MAAASHPQPFIVERKDPEISWDYRCHVPAGEYPAFSRTAKVYRDPIFQRWTCLVAFDLLDSSLVNVLGRVCAFFNLGAGPKPRAGRRSRFWTAWLHANNGCTPARRDRLTLEVFRNRHARVLVRDTTRNFQGVTGLDDARYSVVEQVLSWESGGLR